MANLHGLPKTLKIGALTYKINKVADDEQKYHFENGDIMWGKHSYVDQTISVNHSTKTKDQVSEIVIHETLHALYDHFDLPTENEEKIVTALGTGLTMFFKDNPEFVSYMKRYLK